MKKFKVAVSTLNQTVKAPTGLLYYYAQLAHLLPEVDPETEYHFLVGAGGGAYFHHNATAKVRRVGWDNAVKPLRIATEHFLVGPWAAANGIDVLYIANAGVAPMLLPDRVKLVLAVFGFHQFTRGETGAVASAYRKAFYSYSLARANRIVLNSLYSRTLLEQSATVDRERIDIFPHGRDEELFHAGPLTAEEQTRFSALGLPNQYVCFVSQMYPYKNVECAVEGFCQFVLRTGAPQHFVLVGQFDTHGGAGFTYKKLLIEIATRHGLADRLVFMENISAKLLRALYLGADAYIQSSLSETFGKTTVEAMACGCPVIAARAAATPEVLGDAGLYYEPRDADGLASQLVLLAQSPGLSADLRARGLARSQLFSIREEARLLSEVFKHAARG